MGFIFLWAVASAVVFLVIVGLSTVLEAIFDAIRGYKE